MHIFYTIVNIHIYLKFKRGSTFIFFPAEAEKVPETFMNVVNNGFRDDFGDANNAS